MYKILKFRVGINGLEEKIWREIEIPDRRTVADLAYTILASFNSLAYHLYNIKFYDIIYDCWVCHEDDFDDIPKENAVIIPLMALKLRKNDTLEMEYDFGSTTDFKIVYLGDRKVESVFEEENYPIITDGAGCGMLDDVCDFKLKDIVEDTDKLGYSEYYFSPGYETNKKFDYRKYNIKTDNRTLKGKILAIKNGYEVDCRGYE